MLKGVDVKVLLSQGFVINHYLLSIFRFKSIVECDRIILHACVSTHKVASFRSAKLSELYESLKESLENSFMEKNAAKEQKKSIVGVKGFLPGKRRSTQVDARKVAKALEKAEQRRLKRELRQAEV